ncbi:MAG: hypothetical protein AB8I08_39305 [Sandaracinaceae bacterium]
MRRTLSLVALFLFASSAALAQAGPRVQLVRSHCERSSGRRPAEDPSGSATRRRNGTLVVRMTAHAACQSEPSLEPRLEGDRLSLEIHEHRSARCGMCAYQMTARVTGAAGASEIHVTHERSPNVPQVTIAVPSR